MQLRTVHFLCAIYVVGAHFAAAERSSGHPIKKVIKLLEEMKVKAKEQRHDEEHTYGKFVHWCKNSIKALESAIADEKEKITELKGTVEAKTKMVEELEVHIKEIKAEITKMKKAAKAAEDQRKEGHKTYEDKVGDLEDTIKGIEKAIDTLKKAKEDTSFAVLDEAPVKNAIELLHEFAPEKALLLQAAGVKPGGRAGHVKKYAFKSGGVIELLKGLLEDFQKKKLETEKAETNAVNAFALEEKARDNAMDAAQDAKMAKLSALGETKEDLAQAKADLKDTEEELEEDTKQLEDTTKSCSAKATEWEERTKVFHGQNEAIATAIKILAKVTGVSTEAPENPKAGESPADLQTGAISLMQMSADPANPKSAAIGLIRAAAQKAHSKSLIKLADAVAARLFEGTGDNKVFEDVIHMITSMILRLQAEQKDEDEHKEWCDAEVKKTEDAIPGKKETIEELGVKIEKAKAKVQTIAEEIEEATKMAAALKEHLNELSEIREIGHEENKKAIKDAQDAQTAVTNAITVLEEFYESSGAVGLVQRGVDLPEKPSAWDTQGSGVADPNAQPDGIITVLKEVSADFAEMEAETKANEESDEADYKKQKEEAEVEREKRTKEVEMKSQEKEDLIEKSKSLEKKKKGVEGELYSLEQYMKDLEPACISGDSTYEDRKKARADEVDALKSARKTLKDAFKKDEFLQIRREA